MTLFVPPVNPYRGWKSYTASLSLAPRAITPGNQQARGR